MKEIIRIILLILSIQYAFFDECFWNGNECGGNPDFGFRCKVFSNGDCKETPVCSFATSNEKKLTDEECRTYVLYDYSNYRLKEGYICVGRADGSGCDEVEGCPTESKTDSEKKCSDYAASVSTKICKDDGGNKCTEQYLCESVPKPEGTEKIVCSDYPVKTENADSYICVENSNGETPCIEKKKETPKMKKSEGWKTVKI